MTSLTPTARLRPTVLRLSPTAGRVVLGLVLGLALVGAAFAAMMIATAAPRPVTAQVGSPVTLDRGTILVPRVSTTFVPTTQGAPTMEKMQGTVGTDQLQVWVELVGEDPAGFRYAPDQFRLVVGDAAPRTPDGSTLGEGVLPSEASIWGQIWFDSVASVEDSWLEYAAEDGTLVRIPLEKGTPTERETTHQGH